VTHIIVLSDTHIRHGSRRRLPDPVYAALGDADLILHAGDLLVPELLEDLSGFAPVRAVLGNNDVSELVGVLPDQLVFEHEGVRIAMVHDAGPSAGRAARMHRLFPDAALVVFGHSHIPCDKQGVDGQRLFNPGSPTERRRQPRHTFGIIDVEDGQIVAHTIQRL
jgi:putative phosphoesterase